MKYKTEKEEVLALLSPEEYKAVKRIARDEIDLLDDHEELYNKLFYYYVFETGQMPYGTAKARTGDPIDWIMNRLDELF